mmetsp:Transcript_42616/g.102756  ORF Transcript_42616/g.102756 Transcript_42616/m.102756 type:complete len:257 (+) Transcript_42616:230-1000(+)
MLQVAGRTHHRGEEIGLALGQHPEVDAQPVVLVLGDGHDRRVVLHGVAVIHTGGQRRQTSVQGQVVAHGVHISRRHHHMRHVPRPDHLVQREVLHPVGPRRPVPCLHLHQRRAEHPLQQLVRGPLLRGRIRRPGLGGVGDGQGPADAPQGVRGEVGHHAVVHAHRTPLHDAGQGHVLEGAVDEVPALQALACLGDTGLTLLPEPEVIIHVPVLMGPSQQRDAVRVEDFQREENGNHLQAEPAPVHIVPEEDVAGVA